MSESTLFMKHDAILDLIASLRWMADNITAFGGDPNCVTIFGESSGGHNVVALLASPLAAGLFHRAIIESGSFDSVTRAEAEGISVDTVVDRLLETVEPPRG